MGCSSTKAAALPAVDDPSLLVGPGPSARDEAGAVNVAVHAAVNAAPINIPPINASTTEANESDTADAVEPLGLKSATAPPHPSRGGEAMATPRARIGSSRQTFGVLS